jgi:hypothetical protein
MSRDSGRLSSDRTVRCLSHQRCRLAKSVLPVWGRLAGILGLVFGAGRGAGVVRWASHSVPIGDDNGDAPDRPKSALS